MTDDFKEFPSYSKAKEFVKKLNKTEWPKFDENDNVDNYISKVEKILFQDFEILPDILKRFKPKEFPLPIFRARELKDFKNINLFSEHSYPPANLVGFNRCNFPKYPVFYCSDNPLTALTEVIRNSNHKERKFCVSKWELIDVEQEFVFQTFLHSELDNENAFAFLKQAELEQLDQPFENKLGEDKKAGLAELIKFLHNTFIKDNNYSLSASLAHRTLNAKHSLATDILMYPSVQTKYKGVNMAIHPNFVDNMMTVQRFYIIELENYNIDTGKFDITISKYADLVKNRIFWRDIKPEDELYKKYLIKDFKHIMEQGFTWKFNEVKK